MIRVGFAKDIHKFEQGNGFKLGGVFISCDKKFIAHSDGDVVYHALAEAILGSIAYGDLGTHFPNTDEKYKNMDSSKIVEICYSFLQKEGYKINNIDISIELENIMLKNYISQIRKNICELLNLNLDQVSVKAMTNEGLDAVGKGEACIAYCSILVEK